MAKNKKVKEKVEKGMRRKKWGPVKTSISVVGGVAGIVGATVLGVYLAGGFNEKIINPESISFVYDSSLYNSDYNQIETCENFTLTIGAPNSNDVNRGKVTLSFAGTSNPITRSNGYISNTIISVPEIVKVGQPFSVSLSKEYLYDYEEVEVDENNFASGTYYIKNGDTYEIANGEFDANATYYQRQRISWIKGGVSSLIAASEYDQISTTSIQIAVDVPVYKTETIIINSYGVETNKIVTGEAFTLRTKFIPAKSQYMYSDYYENRNGEIVKNQSIGENAAREKLSYYEAKNNSGIRPFYDGKDTMHFVAGNNAVDNIDITGYTYPTAKEQIEFQKTLEGITEAEYYNANVVRLASSETKISSVGSIEIGEASISTFSVSQTEINAQISRSLRIYVQENRYDSLSSFIGAKVYATSGAVLDNMCANIALAFVYNNQDAVENGIVTVVGEETDKIVTFDENTVKLYKPNSADVADLRYSYWTISASEERNIKIYVYLIKDNELFTDDQGNVVKKELTLSVTDEMSTEADLSWKDDTELSVTLDYDKNGVLKSQPVNLAELINDVPAGNIYKDVKFFAYFSDLAAANEVLKNGYDAARSGNYTIGNSTKHLFALNTDNDTVTLYGTGEFDLYFATITGQYNEDGTYKIAKMCADEKHIVSKKALSSNSINLDASTFDLTNFGDADADSILLDVGNNNSFTVTFVVNADSIPVFSDERDNMSLSIISNKGDITNKFSIGNPVFNNITGELTYTIYLASNAEIDGNEANILSFKLVHADGLSWAKEIPNVKTVTVYKPVASSVVVKNEPYREVLIGIAQVSVEQKLNAAGGFTVTINVGEDTFDSVNNFINELFSDITITDQKDNKVTLSGKWEFEVLNDDEQLVVLSNDKKSFTLRSGNTPDGEPVTLKIKSGNTYAMIDGTTKELSVKLNIESTGIDHILKAGDYDGSGTARQEDTSLVEITKYGRGGDTLTLSDLVKFYLSNDNTQEFSKVDFKLSQQYLTLNADKLSDLFGTNGMIALYSGENPVNYGTGSNLSDINFTKFTINKHFNGSHTIDFEITGGNGAVNTTFSLTLENYTEVGAPDKYNPCYASKPVEITNEVTYRGGGNDTTLGALYSSDTKYYIVPSNDGQGIYVLTNEERTDAIGTLENGAITFYDFWDKEQKEYSIKFQPYGENQFLLQATITFTVKRNVAVTSKNKAFTILIGEGEDHGKIADYIEVTRVEGENEISNITYRLGDYLTYDNAGNVAVKENSSLEFAYNQQELTTKLYVTISGSEVGSIDITIKPTVGNYYKQLANMLKLQSQTEVSAQFKTIGEVSYLLVDKSKGTTWKFNDTNIAAARMSGLYTVVDGNIIFQNQNELIRGIGDENSYLSLSVNSQFTMRVPVIVSSIGFDQVVYEGHKQDAKSLEYALTRPENLIKQGIYNTVKAGELTQILNNTNGLGLFGQAGNIHAISFYALNDATVDKNGNAVVTAQDLINSLTIDNGEVTASLTLNHLSDKINNMYLAFEYTIIKGVATQTFYYVVKVDPDVKVNDVVYPYDGDAEYLSAEVGVDGQINLDGKFDERTLHSGEKRFNITHITQNDNLINNLEFINEIVSVTIDDHITLINKDTIGDQTGWSNYIELAFSSDYKTLTFNPKTNNKFAVLIKHSYPAVIGGDQYYTLVLNENTVNYSLRYTNGGSISANADYTWETNSYSNTRPTTYVKVEFTYTVVEGAFDDNTTYYTKDGDDYVKAEGITEFADGVTYYTRDTLAVDTNKTYYTKYGNDYVKVDITANYYTFAQATTYNSNQNYYTTTDDGKTYTQATGVTADNFSNYYILVQVTTTTKTYYTKDGDKYVKADIIEFADGIDYYVKADTIKVNLIENAEAGQAQSGTVILDKLEIKKLTGEKIEYTYDKHTGDFIVELDDYISQDQTYTFEVYTKYGHLGTLTLVVKANASFEIKEAYSNLEIMGGSSTGFNNVFIINRDGQTVNEGDYSVNAKVLNPDYVKATKYEEGRDYYIYDNTAQKYTKATEVTEESVANYYVCVEYIKLKNNGFNIVDIINDKMVNIQFDIKFNSDGKTFTFTQEFTLKANITPKTTYTPEINNVIAGDGIVIDDVSNFYIVNGTASNTLSIASVTSTSPVFSGYDDGVITTNDVAEVTPLNLTITVRVNDKETFDLTYSLMVYPKVQLETTYPNPTKNENEEISVEYIQNNANFAKMLNNFINSNPIFGDKNRIIAKQATQFTRATTYNSNQVYYTTTDSGETYTKATDVTAENFSNYYVNIVGYLEFTRATTYNSNQVYYTTTDGGETYTKATDGTVTAENFSNYYVNNTEINDDNALTIKITKLTNASVGDYRIGDTIANDKAVTLSRGNGSEASVVEFEITYHAVVTTYTLNILDTIISPHTNMVSNNVGSDIVDESQIDVETIYVDKTSTSNLFANGRMAKVQINNNITVNIGTYYLVFKDSTGYYLSYPIYITSADQGKNLTIDLGQGFAGCTFVGAYLASEIDKQEYGISIGADRMLAGDMEFDSNGKITVNSSTITNCKDDIFAGELILANRIQLRYAGLYDVDYSYYKDILKDLSLSGSTNEIDKTNTKNVFLSSFSYANGTNGTSASVDLSGFKYYYNPTIDIDVTQKISMAGNLPETLEANLERESVVDLFGIIHPTNGKSFEKADFSGDARLQMSIVQNPNGLNDPVVGRYIANYGSFSTGRQYLLFTALTTNSNKAYDYNLLPLGAKNTGDYQLIQITYSVSEYTKTYYVAVKIDPDYVLSFGGSTGNTHEEQNGEIVSNLTPYAINTTGDTYDTFRLTSTADQSGYLSVKHKNGNNTSELASSNFKITLTTDKEVGDETYNNANNVANKLMKSNSNWEVITDSPERKVYQLKSSSDNTSFTGINRVVFADQHYMIEGEDGYGYKYRVYFTLQSQYSVPEPVEQTYELREGEKFDIGAQFQLLTIEKDTTGNEIYITSETTDPVNNNNTKLVTLGGISGWLFDKDYTDSSSSEIYYLDKDGNNGYTAVDQYTISSSDGKYLYINNLILKYVTVEGVKFYSGGNPIGESTINTANKPFTLATAKSDTAGKYTFNGYNGRDVYSSTDLASFDSGTAYYTISKATNANSAYKFNNGKYVKATTVTAEYLKDYYSFALTSDTGRVGDKEYYIYNNNQYTTLDSTDTFDPATVYEKTKVTQFVADSGQTSMTVYYWDGESYKPNQIANADYLIDYYTFGNDGVGDNPQAGVKYYIKDGNDYKLAASSENSRCLTVPTIEATNIYGASNVANVVMKVKLKYTAPNGGDTEYYYCNVNVALRRGLDITEIPTLLTDGSSTAVAGCFNVTDNNGYKVSGLTYLNDTLEVVIAANSSVSFNLRDRDTTEYVSLTNSGTPYAKTYYISLSSKLNKTLEGGNTITISDVTGGCLGIYYLTNDSMNVNKLYTLVNGDAFDANAVYYTENNGKYTVANISAFVDGVSYYTRGDNITITISEIEWETVYVDNAAMIRTNGYYTINKYYILVNNDNGYRYRISKLYYVTGKYYKMQEQTETVIPVNVNVTVDGDKYVSTIPWSNWKNAIKLYEADVETGISQGKQIDTDDVDNQILQFYIDSTSGGSGYATIDNDGKIKLLDGWTSDQYLTIIIKMKVSGYDRKISDDSDNAGEVTLGSVRICGQYNITYLDENGEEYTGSVTGPAKAVGSVTLPSPTKEYYTFVGWYSDSGCTQQIANNQLNNVNLDTTVYAKWRKNILTVNYHLNGGTAVASQDNSFNSGDPAFVQPWVFDSSNEYGLYNPDSTRVIRPRYTADENYYNTEANGTGINISYRGSVEEGNYVTCDSVLEIAEILGLSNDFKTGDISVDLYVIWIPNT